MLGLCLGLQCMVIEFARSVAGIDGASSSEFDPQAPAPVIATMAEQEAFVDGAGDLGGTMRLGLYPAALKPGTLVAQAYGLDKVEERHRHRYEVNNRYREQLEAAGLVFSGTSPDSTLVEFVELPREVHPYYVATQAHPELRSRPTRPHPLFSGLVQAALDRQRETRLPVEADLRPVERSRTGRRMSRPHPDLPGELADPATLADSPHAWPVSTSTEGFSNGYLRVDIDTIVDPGASEHARVVVQPHGAVGVLAIDDADRVLLVEQYRHPVRHRMLEIPAGTLDVEGEDPLAAADPRAGRGGRPRRRRLGSGARAVRDARATPASGGRCSGPPACTPFRTPSAPTGSPRRATCSSGGCRSTRPSTPCSTGGSPTA